MQPSKLLSVQIRIATRADEPALQHVIRTVYEEYDWGWFPDGYHEDLYDIETFYFAKGNQFFVAELDGEVVGTAAVDFMPQLPQGDGTVVVDGVIRVAAADCSLERLYVLPHARGKGVGSGLWRATIEAAKEKGCKVMEIWSDKRLEDAHRLYEKLGAIRAGERLCHDPDQSPEWGMAFNI
jgi:GNAT superfamily N-acetyltransferase